MSKQTKAIIYVRGNNKETQELLCRIYAFDKGYKVLYVTQCIEDVNLCDILLVTSPSRISREQIDYIQVSNDLKEKGIEIVNVANQDDAHKSVSLVIELFKESKIN